ncbi:glycerol kinase [Fructilactobacillus lindneri]|uniref:Glycerol kinase n=2 Tax=Fructilactobacillus lindneri TaxID=53444 RepID=A0A0R2JWJ0_9LACO|nr:glycerol kinase GlpK [Fructilactobacillus lindneri]ANZ57443.1 glycerol kinase [Fructilactobacillus lindneri]ANZ58711.1 glycerol kinase [Fructilactobacillus lindneri]KRN80054.1 glycerol kinase [Fructilactobacillus lindneri DSM 20690 = JCM 11027]POG97929.1 glycerol kinase [Fructilactobacillus lindneri]POG99261.1 glycerol kinase [Fructilactobacillus lindneri]
MGVNEAKYVLAIDQGSTSTRAVIYDHSGRKVIESTKPLPQISNKNGWVEQNPDTIWSSVLSAIASAMIDARIHPESINSIGITNQRETTVVWDKQTGKPIYNAIGWLSKQTTEISQKLREAGYSELIRKKTGLVLNAYFSATKVRWILDHVAGAQERAEKGELLFGTIDTWLVWKLSDGKYHITDYTNASRTMMYNIHELKWDQELLDILNIPKQMLPTVHASDEIYGTTENYQFYGVSVPIAGIAGDQQAALIGSMGFEPGMVEDTYGDGSFIMMNTGTTPEISRERLLTTIAYGIGGKVVYALEGSIFIAGSALIWLRDQLGLIKSVPESRLAAKRSHDNNDIYVVPAFTGLGAPYWDASTRGAIFGITRGTTDDDIVKATLQSIAYSTKDIIDTMEADTEMQIPLLSADGGASRNSYLMQFQADILGRPVQRTSDEETTAFGAAILTGLATGFWKDLDEVKSIYEAGKIFQPKMDEAERKKLYRGWKNAIQAARYFKPQQD